MDDDRDLREALSDLLDLEGFSVLAAANAAEAHARSLNRALFAALVDVNLPGSNGVVLAEELQRSHPEIRLFVMSGMHGTVTPPDTCLLKKPFSVGGLVDRLKQDSQPTCASAGAMA